MGRMGADAMAEATDIDTALAWHLSSNHYPPVPSSMIAPCKAAIEAANEDNWDAEIELPDGILFRGKPTAPVHAMVDQHHLGSWIYSDDEEIW